MIKIIGGKYKGTLLEVPLEKVRPTSTMKREAIFSSLESYAYKNSLDLYKNKCFVDLFAGSGSMGLEAISRGSSFVYFSEINKTVSSTLEINCKKICQKNQFKIFRQDSSLINNFKTIYPVSVIFIDPPYRFEGLSNFLKKILKLNILSDESIVVIETSKIKLIDFLENFKIIKEKVYGKTKIFFLKIN